MRKKIWRWFWLALIFVLAFLFRTGAIVAYHASQPPHCYVDRVSGVAYCPR